MNMNIECSKKKRKKKGIVSQLDCYRYVRKNQTRGEDKMNFRERHDIT